MEDEENSKSALSVPLSKPKGFVELRSSSQSSSSNASMEEQSIGIPVQDVSISSTLPSSSDLAPPASSDLEDALIRVSELTKKYWKAQEVAEKERKARSFLENELQQKHTDLTKERAIREMLEIDQATKNRDLVALQANLKDSQTSSESHLKALSEQYESEKNAYGTKIDDLNTEHSQLSTRLENALSELDKSRQEISKVENVVTEKENKLVISQVESERYREDLKSKENLLEQSASHKDELQKKILMQEAEKKIFSEQLDSANKEIKHIKELLDVSETKLVEKESAVNEAEKLLLQKNEDLNLCQSKFTQQQEKNKIQLKLLEEVNMAKDDFEKKLSDLSSGYSVLVDNFEKNQNELGKAKDEITSLHKYIDEIESGLKEKDKDILLKNDELGQCRTEMDDMRAYHEKSTVILRAECKALEEESKQQISELTDGNKNMKLFLNSLHQKVSDLESESEGFEQILSGKEEEYLNSLSSKDKQITDNELLISKLQKEIECLKQLEEESKGKKKEYNKQLNEMTTSNDAMIANSQKLLDDLRGSEEKMRAKVEEIKLLKTSLLTTEENLQKKDTELVNFRGKICELDMSYQRNVKLLEKAEAEKIENEKKLSKVELDFNSCNDELREVRNELSGIKVTVMEKEVAAANLLEKELRRKNEYLQASQAKLHKAQIENRRLDSMLETVQKKEVELVEKIGNLSSCKMVLLKNIDDLEQKAIDDRMIIASMEAELEAEKFPQESTHVRIMILCERVNDVHKKMIQSISGVLVHRVEDAPIATHVIAGNDHSSLRRTSKLMIALSCTENILHMDWLAHSARAGKLLPCKNYLLLFDKKSEKEQNIVMRETIRNGRACRRSGGLLFGYSIYFCKGVAGKSSPPEHELNLIISSAGGVFLQELSQDCYPENTIIIASDPVTDNQRDEPNVEMVAQEGNGFFTSSWLFQCIMTQELNFQVYTKKSLSTPISNRKDAKYSRSRTGSLSCAISVCSIDSSKSGLTRTSRRTYS
eukprot:CAMPEP_0113310462 /NCGR_PEP_ID=MMETSP0010_2-20120614/8097_1 /TAXON_ID=216773 ORGANISM="Corethron hystrix, Strain 308" /NCGR_SAMPLE_ID=MMETSP0010_2 /ASSEMBLY_ACC=CAM_ASM_000155 /LENGTH=999 /DNA_ID=CAMNT_0000165921 /DNA_START=211 /DNA_END=3210 /DNA_ORIENTATION=- /assembly_acc=CAM_ASM_000155